MGKNTYKNKIAKIAWEEDDLQECSSREDMDLKEKEKMTLEKMAYRKKESSLSTKNTKLIYLSVTKI